MKNGLYRWSLFFIIKKMLAWFLCHTLVTLSSKLPYFTHILAHLNKSKYQRYTYCHKVQHSPTKLSNIKGLRLITRMSKDRVLLRQPMNLTIISIDGNLGKFAEAALNTMSKKRLSRKFFTHSLVTFKQFLILQLFHTILVI